MVEAAIASCTSRTVAPEALGFAKAVVRAADPSSTQRARSLLFATSRLGAFALSHGLELDPQALLCPSVIERFCLTGASAMSHATRRTLRTNLRHVSSRVLPQGRGPTRIAREKAKAPYSDAEIAAYLALADAQPSASRSRRASALICLGAGAGLVGADLRAVRGSDVVTRFGGVIVAVGGRTPRVVPVRAEFHERLLHAARIVSDGYVIGFSHPRRKNVTTPLVASLAGGRDLPSLDTGRLRSTWLARCAEDLGLRAFLDAAGVRCSQRLGDIVAGLDPPDEARAVELLSGTT